MKEKLHLPYFNYKLKLRYLKSILIANLLEHILNLFSVQNRQAV